jgi:hypothetical protein
MSIERRCILRKRMTFESGLILKPGTIIYVEETPAGWIGSYYDDPTKAGASCFALTGDEFAVLQRADTVIETLIVVPDPPEPTEEQQERIRLARARVERKAEEYRAEAAKLEELLQ